MQEDHLRKALKKAQLLLSRRPHSSGELEQKLLRFYEQPIVDQALEYCTQNKWLLSEEELGNKLLQELHQKNKGWLYIRHYFKNKGLAPPPYDKEKEIEKATNLIHKKYSQGLQKEKVQEARRFLSYRGFEGEIISELLSY